MKLTFAKPDLPASGALVVAVSDGGTLLPTAKELDKLMKGALSRAVKGSRFTGAKGQTLTLLEPANLGLSRLVAVGIGKPRELNELGAREVGGAALAALNAGTDAQAAVMVEAFKGCKLTSEQLAAQMAYGALLRSYRFDKYRTKEDEAAKPKLKGIKFLTDEHAKARVLFERAEAVAAGVFLTRDLVTEPANVLYPASFADEAEKLEDLGVKVQVLGEKEMRKLGMNALLGVGQGSDRESRLVVMQWLGGGTGKAGRKGGAKAGGVKAGRDGGPIAIVGKGVCFDSGGISIKPSAGMEDMKWDMGGAGVVVGLMKALAGRKAKADVIGVVGLVENMPSGTAQRPGDVVTSASGQTIEVLNTDAEGRLVLADALWYTIDRFKPRAVIDLATLTGAIMVALGESRAGLFSNNERLATWISQAGEAEGEPVWRMPLGPEYDELIKSDIADMKNIGGRYGGSITAAQFLQRFVGDAKWAHLDIAGVTWSRKDNHLTPKGGTAFGVRLLDRLIADRYEK